MKKIKILDFEISNSSPLVLIAGPCMLESRDHALMMADKIKTLTDK